MIDSAETYQDTRMDSDCRPEQVDPSLTGGGFPELLARCEEDLRRVVAGMGFGRADADDILQDVHVEALRSRGEYRGEKEACRWLLRVTVNRCMLEFRRRQRFRRRAADILARQQVEARPADNPEAEALRVEELERIRFCLQELDENLLTPLVLKYFNGLTSEQIGEVLDMPAGTVRSRLHEARLVLARRLMEGERR